MDAHLSVSYEEAAVNERFSATCRALSEALAANPKKKKEFKAKLEAYLQAREKFRAALSEDDYKYFSFQLWKEGVARYTEYQAAFHSPLYFVQTGDSKEYAQAARELEEEILGGLSKLSLREEKRVAFYTFGAAEALLLDRANSFWHKHYFKEKFFLEKYYAK